MGARTTFPQKKIVQDLRERTVEGFLDFLIFAILSKNSSMTAEDLMGYIHRKFEVSISSGILCSHLFYLEKEGLIHGANVKNKKVYRLTSKGKEKILIARKYKSATQWVIDQMFE